MNSVRALAKVFRRTPFHPQWLLGSKVVPEGMDGLAGRVLDVGSADGWIRPYLPAALEYIGLDYPATGKGLYGARPDVFADAEMLPFADESFDAVVCLEVLEHVKHPDRVLAEVARVLKPGANAWFSTPFLYPIHDAPHDYQRFTEHGWRQRVHECGLELVSLRKAGHAIATAGLLLCLAISGGVMTRRGLRAWVMAAVSIIAIPAINVMARIFSMLTPDWGAMGTGYQVRTRKSHLS